MVYPIDMKKKKKKKKPSHLKLKPVLLRLMEIEHADYKEEAGEEGRDLCSYIRYRLKTHPAHQKWARSK